jgi:NAD(P)H-dependent FMN reductase
MDKITIAVLAGTTREKRLSLTPARYIEEFGKKLPDCEVIFVDPKDFNFPGDGNDPEGKDPRYSAITEKADGFFIVVPEYNHSFPGSLKRMLDSEWQNYFHKPVAFAGVSDGGWGGTRAIESIVPVVREMRLVVLGFDVYFPRVQDIFEDSGQMKAQFTERYDKSLGDVYSELLWFARLLKTGRTSRV